MILRRCWILRWAELRFSHWTDGVDVTRNGTSQILFNVKAADSFRRKGDTKEIDLLFLGIPRLTDYTQALSGDSVATIQKFSDELGLRDGKPTYQIKPKAGKVLLQRYLLNIDGGEDNCFSGQLRGNLIASLPVTVSHLNPNWSSYLYDRRLQQARPLGMLNDAAWATVTLHDQDDLFIGQPVTCDQAEVRLQITQSGENNWHIEAHNPTDHALTATLHANPFFDPWKKSGFQQKTVHLPAGASVWFEVESN